MKITIEAHPPRWLKWGVLLGAIPAMVLFGLVRFLQAEVAVPNTFASGDLMSSAKINENFKALQTGINTLGATVTTMQAGVAPAGSITAFGGPVAPTGWLLCDGAAVSRDTYAALFKAIGTVHGSGDGATTFNLPDLRGRFLRGVDHGKGRDPDAANRSAATTGGQAGDSVGTVQDGEYASHNHGGFTTSDNGNIWYWTVEQNFAGGADNVLGHINVSHNHGIPAGGGKETRPVNLAVEFIIKY